MSRVQLTPDIVENELLYFNSVEQVMGIFVKLNKQFRFAALSHLSKRIHILQDETKRYEEAFENLVASIKIKRDTFYR